MTNWCCLCNSDPCDCKARVQRKKDAALAAENERLTKLVNSVDADNSNDAALGLLRKALGTRDVHGVLEGIERLTRERNEARVERDTEQSFKTSATAERDQLREQLEAARKDSERRAFDRQYPPALECMRCEGLGCSLCKEVETK